MINLHIHRPSLGMERQVNPGVESSPGNNWQGYWGCPFVRDAVEVHNGNYSAKFTTNRIDQRQGARSYNQFYADHGTYICSAWVKIPVNGSDYVVSGWGTYFESGGLIGFTPTGNWQFVESLPFTVNRATHISVQVRPLNPIPPMGSVFWIDDVSSRRTLATP